MERVLFVYFCTTVFKRETESMKTSIIFWILSNTVSIYDLVYPNKSSFLSIYVTQNRI